MFKYLLLFLSLLSFAHATPWVVLYSGKFEIQTTTETSRIVPLHLVIESTSGWDNLNIIELQVRKASGILSQCGLEIGDVSYEVVMLAPYVHEAFKNPNPYKGPSEMILVNGITSPVRPLAFLFKRSTVNTASAFNQKSITALSTGSTYDPRGLLNTSTISDNHILNSTKPDYLSSYNTLAHELVHIFGDVGHVAEKDNLMSSLETPGSKSGRLNATQCQQIQAF